METINRIPIQHAMFIQATEAPVVNSEFQMYLMEMFKAQSTVNLNPVAMTNNKESIVQTEISSAERETLETEMIQMMATMPSWIAQIIPQVQEELSSENNPNKQNTEHILQVQKPINLEQTRVMDTQIRVIDTQARIMDTHVQDAVPKEFTQMIKTIQEDVQSIKFEPESQEAKLHFERLRKPIVHITPLENVQTKPALEMSTVDKVGLPQVERASIDLNELVSIIKQHDQSKDGTYTLKLKPEGIGEIVIKFEQKDNSFKLTLNSPNTAVHNLFEKVLPELKNQMQDIQWEVQYGQQDAQKREQQFHQHKHGFKQEEPEETIVIRTDHYDRSQT